MPCTLFTGAAVFVFVHGCVALDPDTPDGAAALEDPAFCIKLIQSDWDICCDIFLVFGNTLDNCVLVVYYR